MAMAIEPKILLFLHHAAHGGKVWCAAAGARGREPAVAFLSCSSYLDLQARKRRYLEQKCGLVASLVR
jgi:hypothetical protein